MNKQDLVQRIAEIAGLTKADATRAVNAFEEAVVEGTKKHGKVTLVGFGTWENKKRSARTGRNPRTGAEVKIAARNVPTFKPGSKFKDALN